MFSAVRGFFWIAFLLVVGFIIITAIRGGMHWNKNNHSPILTVDAKVVAKRMAVSNHSHIHDNGAHAGHSSSTTYYATFEVDSGDRMELKTPDREYGMLAEGDTGHLTFQGTRYKAFERTIKIK